MDVGLGRGRTDILVRPSSLGGHLRVKIFLPFFFFTVGNFSEADVSNLNPRWQRARADARGHAQMGEDARRRVRTCADGCARAQTGKGARRRVRAGADVYACLQTLPPARICLPKKWIPVGSAQGLQQFRLDYLSFKHE